MSQKRYAHLTPGPGVRVVIDVVISTIDSFPTDNPGWVDITNITPIPTPGATTSDNGATFTPADTTAAQAAAAQQTAVANLLAGAQASIDRLTAIETDLAQLATTKAAAKATLTTAITALPAAATGTQISTFIKGALATYLTADDTALNGVGQDVKKAIDELMLVERGLGNFIANQLGATTTF